ncbi:unnamed protein product [Plutella xylostella]|uniref:(diamondback moth) hypothetical protein n=1 Tax=Plutella xylostella TaxID=51655 RepID=A0A8S4DC24_PLUXY|nr:unnamed protein product [Plutella xylostella]
MSMFYTTRHEKESRTDVQFHLAALRGDAGRLRTLLDTGKVHIDSRDRDGTTPLILSAAMGHTECVRELLAQGADPACSRTTGTSALFFAAQGGFLDIAQVLLDHGAAIDAPSTDGGTPLFVACQCGHLPVVEELIRRGANVNSCMKDKATPLFIAAQNGHEDVCRALLTAGACVDRARLDRATPLWIAAQCGHDHVVRLLLAAGAYVDQLRQNVLVSAGACVDRATPLWIAAQCGHDHVVRLLLAARAYVDQLRQSKNLHFLPLQATHHPPNSEPTLLDLIIVSSPDHVLKHGQFTADCFSYHDLLYLSYKVRTPKPKKRTILQRNFKNMDIPRLLEDAKDIEWARLNDIDNIDERVELFNSLLTNLFDKHAPLRPVRVKQLPAPWLTDKIKGLMTKRDHAKYRYKKQPTDDNLCAYKELRNRCNRVCRDAKRRYIHTSIENCENSQLWNFLKTLGIGKIKATSNIDINLSALNKHFSTPPLILSDQIRTETLNHLSDMPVPDCPPFNFKLVTGRDVKRCISAITSKAVGTDDISANMINSVLDIILPHITNLMNLSLISSSFPSLWKNAFILPLPKIPSPTSLTQFRPISILPFLSKVLERLVFEQFSSFLSGNQLLNSYQSGFRPGHSTVTALIKVTDDIRYNIDNQNVTVLALLDFSNAFNSVDFDLLLGTIRSLNVSPAVTSWFETYLKGRQQCVRTDTETSSWCPVLAGVPQGGVLSPLLFSLFINILASKLTSLYHLYADDLQLYTGVPPESLNTAVSPINDNLAIISKWVKSFGLLLNPSKSQAIVLGSSRMLNKIDFATAARIRYDQIDIPYVTSVKNLGVIMDSTLSWIPQVDAVSRKMFASFHSLKRLQYFLPFMTKITLAQSLLLPILDYADDGATPLFKAAHKGHTAVVGELLKYKPNVGLLPNGQTALHGAAMSGELSCVKLLATRGGIRTRSSQGLTPALAAAAAGKKSVAQYLREKEGKTK